MNWETARDRFLNQWKDRSEVIGIVVCGSYITGHPSIRSDIDIHILLSDECNWRERGNQYVEGYLIEYFVNPPKQIRAYFEEDYCDRSTMSMVQFLTGSIVMDKQGIVSQLVEEAEVWKNKRYEPLSEPIIELKKYELWDALDNLLDCYEQGREDFEFVYHHCLNQLVSNYCFIINTELIPAYQLVRYYKEPSFLTKYRKEPFRDEHFARLVVEAVTTKDRDGMMTLYEQLTTYVLDQAGGFSIDGWKLKSSLSLS